MGEGHMIGRHSGTHDLSQALVKAGDAIRSCDVREEALAAHHQGLQVHLHRLAAAAPTIPTAEDISTTTTTNACIHLVCVGIAVGQQPSIRSQRREQQRGWGVHSWESDGGVELRAVHEASHNQHFFFRRSEGVWEEGVECGVRPEDRQVWMPLARGVGGGSLPR